MFLTSIYIVTVHLLIWDINGTYAIGQLYTSEGNNTYYIELQHESDWFQAQQACSKMNMTLVEISSNTKSLELITLIIKAQKQNNYSGRYLWTGGKRNKLPADNFVWHSTGEKIIYTNWYESYPDSRNLPEVCIEIVDDFDWKWRDYECSSKNGFVCENKPETIIRKKFQNLEQNLQTEIEKNRNLHKELQQQQNEHQAQLRQLTEQHLKAQHQFQLQSQLVEEQKLKLEKDLQAEIIRENNLIQHMASKQKLLDQQQEQIKQLKEEQRKAIELRENKPLQSSKEINFKINKGTTVLQQSNRPINIIYFKNIYSN